MAASLPDGSSNPYSSAFTVTCLPLGSRPTRLPGGEGVDAGAGALPITGERAVACESLAPPTVLPLSASRNQAAATPAIGSRIARKVRRPWRRLGLRLR